MSAALTQVLRSRWLTWFVHVGLWILLYLAAIKLGGKAPAFHEGLPASSPAVQVILPVPKLDPLFSPAVISKSVSSPTNVPNPFFTRFFVPAPPVAPPAPTTRKLDVIYQGFYQTENGPRFAVLSVAGGLMVAKIGALVATNVYVADASLQSVVLTNTSAQTNILTLNTKKEIEVPIR
jgi:hypothetical protein